MDEDLLGTVAFYIFHERKFTEVPAVAEELAVDIKAERQGVSFGIHGDAQGFVGRVQCRILEQIGAEGRAAKIPPFVSFAKVSENGVGGRKLGVGVQVDLIGDDGLL